MVTIKKFKKSLDVNGDTTTVYTLEGVAKAGDCGQVDLPSADVKPAQKVDKNLKVGTCASVGYSVADGTTTKKVPVLGTLTISKFKKAALGAAAGSLVMTWKDCGVNADAKVDSISPLSLPLGVATTISGTGD